MKLCYLANAASVHTVRWVNYFAQSGHEVHLISWRKPVSYPELDRRVKLHCLLLPPHYPLTYITFVEAAIRIMSIKPDVIHAHYLGHFGILAGLYRRFFRSRPLVLTAWGSDVLLDAKTYLGWGIKHAVRLADMITCDAEHIADELVKMGAVRERVKLVYFGTDTERFKPQPKNGKVREELALGDAPVVISLRNLKPLYDVASLIRAIPVIQRDTPQAKFVIAGDGVQRPYLEELATELGVTGSVSFIGSVENDYLPRYLNMADVYVSTSLSDAGLSASTAEAMACGLPVVITDFGDNKKWVEDGVSGYLVPLGKPEMLASKITRLLKDGGERKKLGRAGRQVIEEKNNWRREMSKMEEIYKDLTRRYSK